MAKKVIPSPAFEFEFKAAALKNLLASNPDKILFTVLVEPVQIKPGVKVGVLRIKAKGISKKKTLGIAPEESIDGEPRPPGTG